MQNGPPTSRRRRHRPGQASKVSQRSRQGESLATQSSACTGSPARQNKLIRTSASCSASMRQPGQIGGLGACLQPHRPRRNGPPLPVAALAGRDRRPPGRRSVRRCPCPTLPIARTCTPTSCCGPSGPASRGGHRPRLVRPDAGEAGMLVSARVLTSQLVDYPPAGYAHNLMSL